MTGREIVSAIDLQPFGPAGKKWVRFAARHSLGNGAFTQPVVLK